MLTPLPVEGDPPQGAMGVVLPAMHRGRKVAVKVFKAAQLAAVRCGQHHAHNALWWDAHNRKRGKFMPA